MTTVADVFVDALARQGVRHVFGIPGGPWIPYMEAMRRRGMTFVLTANEAAAAFMADVCARLTGIPGVCHGTFGPGATNLATGVCSAYLDRSPIIAVTTEQSAAMRGRVTQMNVDHQALFAPITKWTTRLAEATVADTVERAFAEALAEVPGPVHIGHPVDLADLPSSAPAWNRPTRGRPAPDPAAEDLEAAWKKVQGARTPVVAVGLSAARRRLGEPLRRLVEQLGAPVVLTPMAKGLLPEDHSLYAGVLFHARSDLLAPLVARADLVLGLGYDPVEFNYESWMPEAPLVHVDSLPADLEPGRPVVNCTGDLGAALSFLLSRPAAETGWDAAELGEHRRRLSGALRSTGAAFGPAAALDILRDALPADAPLACDVGAHTHLIGQMWPAPSPDLLLMTNGGSSMGFGVPAAIAAGLCRPGRKVACVTGDAGFLMMAGELVTARRLGLPVVFVVLADHSISLIEVKQGWRKADAATSRMYEGGLFGADRLFGVPVFRGDSRDGFRKALADALALEGPSVVEAAVDGADYHHLIARHYR